MTKEELIKNQFPNDEFLQSGVSQIVDKCIAELEQENARQKAELDAIDKAGEHVRQQINDAFRNKKPYWELEKENLELKADNDARKFAMVMSEKVEKQLREENAKLKEKLKPENCLKLLAKEGYIKFTSDQLTKAKEIIKKFSEFVNNEVEYDPEHPQEHTDLWNKLCEEAEQFLKDCEVEK